MCWNQLGDHEQHNCCPIEIEINCRDQQRNKSSQTKCKKIVLDDKKIRNFIEKLFFYFGVLCADFF